MNSVRWQFSLRALLLVMTTVATSATAAHYADVRSLIWTSLLILPLAVAQLLAALFVHWELRTSPSRTKMFLTITIWAILEWTLIATLLAFANEGFGGGFPRTAVAILVIAALTLVASAWRRTRKHVVIL